jgi:hypothetical protein
MLALVVALAGCKGGRREQRERERRFEAFKQEAIRSGAEAIVAAEQAKLEAQTNQLMANAARSFEIGRKVKVEVDRLHGVEDYMLSVELETAGEPELQAHHERVAKMQTITIGDLTIGYEEHTGAAGAVFAKDFLAEWRRASSIVRLTCYSRLVVAGTVFVDYLRKVVPIVERDVH